MFTIFNKKQIFTNEENSLLLDGFLHFLDDQNEVNMDKDVFIFVGIGYGGFVLSHYCKFLGFWFVKVLVTVANEAVPNFKSMLLVNAFSYVDEILEDVILKAMEQFSLCPPSRPEMAYNFLSVLLHSK